MQIKDYFNLFRWKNLIIIILIQVLIKFVLFQKFELSTTLDNLHFSLLVLSTIFIVIAGYIINDTQDIKADIINKPNKVFVSKKLSITKANNLFIIFNSIGLLLGFYLSIHINKNSFFIIFIIISLLLYRYSISLKKRLLVGNLVVSLIVFLGVILIVLFDIVPVTNSYNNQVQLQVTKLVLILSGFAFFLTLLREITKDLEDKKGDVIIDANTLPIAFGDNKTKIILIFISLIPLIAINYFIATLYPDNLYLIFFLIAFVSLPLLYFVLKIKMAKTKKDYHNLSNLLKVIMLFGTLSILFF